MLIENRYPDILIPTVQECCRFLHFYFIFFFWRPQFEIHVYVNCVHVFASITHAHTVHSSIFFYFLRFSRQKIAKPWENRSSQDIVYTGTDSIYKQHQPPSLQLHHHNHYHHRHHPTTAAAAAATTTTITRIPISTAPTNNIPPPSAHLMAISC